MSDERLRVELRVPFTTLLKIAFFLVLILCVIRLWLPFLFFIIAVLLAVTLAPVVEWMHRFKIGKSFAVLLIGLLIIASMGLFFGVLVPEMADQFRGFEQHIGTLQRAILQRIPSSLQPLREAVEHPQQAIGGDGGKQLAARSLAVGVGAIEAVSAVLFIIVVTLYLLLEGKTMYAWLVSFVPEKKRDRVAATAEEVAGVMRAYIRGQALTSACCGAYVFVVTLALGVPGALLLAVAAALLDVIPVIGTILLVGLPALVAMTVSPSRALTVLGLLVLYHFVESYWIVPRIYGKAMRLSTLTVLLAITAAGILQGIFGMLLVLPFVAAYPIIERRWLRRVVGTETVVDHERLMDDPTGRTADDISRL